MFCSKCGKELPENESVCSGCGNRVKTTLNTQQFDLSNVKGTFDNVLSNVKESWASMGKKGILLAAIGALLVVCMFMWRGGIVSISAKGFGGYSVDLKGTLLLNDSGLLKFLVTAGYLVSIGAVAYPFITNTAVTKKVTLLARLGSSFNLGAFLGSLLFGFGEAADMIGGDNIFELLEYVNIGPSGLGWLLIACFVANWVLCILVEKEI